MAIHIEGREGRQSPLGIEDLSALLDTMPALIWIARDPECRVVTENRAASALLGLATGADVSQTAAAQGCAAVVRQFRRDGAEYLPHELPLQRAAASGKPVESVEIDFLLPNGELVNTVGNAAPLFDATGLVRGAIAIFFDVTKRKLAEDRAARAHDQLTNELQCLHKLHELAMRLVQSNSLEVLLNEILGAAMEITAADMGNIQLLGDDGVLRIAAHRGFSAPFLEFFSEVNDDRSACGVALIERQRTVIEDVEQSHVFKGKPSLKVMLDAGARAVQSTPIYSRAGSPIGMLSTHYRQPRRVHKRDLQLIDVLARQAADLIENIRTTQALQAANLSFSEANEGLAEALRQEHRTVQALQQAFLPPFLPRIDGIKFDAFYRPAHNESELGGDWYDVAVLPDGRVAFSIGDILGHGFEAATAMVRLRESLRAVTGFIDDDPGEILRLADRALQTFHPGTIASAVFAIYDPMTRRIRIATAGHPPPAIVRDHSATFIPSSGTLLGISHDSAFPVYECSLEPNDSLVLYTDGLIESGRDVIAGGRNLLQRLAASPFSAEELVGQLVGTDHHDDIAVLIFSVSSPTVASSWRFEADDSRSAAHARSSFVAHLHQLQADEQTIEFAGTVFGELVANVVRHASGPIEIELVRENGDLFLYVRDRGPHFVAGDASLPADIMSEGGRGLFLVRSHASMPVVKRRFGGGNEIHVRLHSRRRDKNAE